MAKVATSADIEKSTNAPKFINKDIDDEDDIDIDIVDVDDQPTGTETKFVASKTRPGVYGLMTKMNGKIVGVVDVPPQYIELAKKNPNAALAKIEADKRAGMDDDDAMMEDIDKHFGI